MRRPTKFFPVSWSARLRARQSLRAELAHYQALLQQLPAAIYTTDVSGRITYYNEAAVQLWGRRPVIGRDKWCGVSHIFTPEGEPMPMEQTPIARALRENREIRGSESVLERPDGSRVPFLPFPKPIRNALGEPVGAINMLVDVSDRKNTQWALERRNKWLRLLAENSAALAEATDPEQMMYSLSERTFPHIDADIFFNFMTVTEDGHSFLRLESAGGVSAAAREDFLQLEMGQSVCGQTAQSRQPCILNHMLDHPTPITAKLRALGVRTYICQPLIAGNEVMGTLSFGSRQKDSFEPDEIEFIKTIGHYVATAKKRLRDDRDLRASEAQAHELVQRAEAANIAKSEFLANMSHEIRTPMNAIVGLTNILDSQDDIPKAKQKEFLRTLKASARQLLDLINDVLDISKIESEHLELEAIPFDLTRLVSEVVSIHNIKAHEKGIAIHMDCGVLPENLVGDPLRIKQVLMNLVGNAVKFTEQGSVSLHVQCLPQASAGQVVLQIDVRDTGIGIKPEQYEAIFSKFTQADTSMTRKFGGSGLGLAISRKLVEAMGGDIVVSSNYGAGSCFSITLPLVVQQGSRVVYQQFGTPAANTQALHGARVLLVEDYAANILVATALLEDFGCEFVVAENGEDALACIREQQFDVILMDVQMPVMDGYETTRHVRRWEEEHHRPRTPIIGVTAHALTADREQCLAMGMDDYMSKPFQPDQLNAKIAGYYRPLRAAAGN